MCIFIREEGVVFFCFFWWGIGEDILSVLSHGDLRLYLSWQYFFIFCLECSDSSAIGSLHILAQRVITIWKTVDKQSFFSKMHFVLTSKCNQL